MDKILTTDFIKTKSKLGQLFCIHTPKINGIIYKNKKPIKNNCQCNKCGKVYATNIK